MNIYEKMQKAKVELQKKELKKTGENKFSHYTYYELGDFMPHINEICLELGLFTQVNFEEKKAILTIINTEKIEEILKYETEMIKTTLKGANEIQSLGGTQTYLRRYLYMNAFEIAESDYIDNNETDVNNANDEEKKEQFTEDKGTEIIDKLKKDLLDDAITKNKISDELVYRIINNYGYTSTAEIKIKDYMNIVSDFKKVVGQKE